ncbi:MAG: DUF91 domain-containing protein [Deltaproteobacteria bacterium]|nr:DUF91 domain-containing protein [Deltaproteobacteria bacterium]
MPIRHAIWKVGTKPEPLAEVSLGKEALLEQMITEDPTILSDRWLLIGRQVRTTHGGFIDLLALNQDGQLIVIELKSKILVSRLHIDKKAVPYGPHPRTNPLSVHAAR